MTNFEMVETLRQHANVSYEEAKQALEETNWDILEAMVLLEKQGKVTGNESGTYTTRQDPRPEKKNGQFKSAMARLAETLIRLIKKGNENFFQVYRRGKMQFEIPVTVLVLLVIFCFWVVAPLMIIGLFTEFRFSFRGPDLDKTKINGAMDKASEFAENIKRDNEEEK